MRKARTCALLVLCIPFLLTLADCGKDAGGGVLGEAYVAPSTLNLRRELSQKNSVADVLNHGDKVGVIDVRRRFVKVRTQKGEEGWVDSLQLLSPQQMDQIKRDQASALKLPSEGAAGVFEALNIHIGPSRQSPAFARIPEGGSVMVLEHRVEPKVTAPPRPPNLVAERPQPLSRRQRKQLQSRTASRLPPPPLPPKPPQNWQELSGRAAEPLSSPIQKPVDEKKSPAQNAEEKKPVILEDWTLVRTKDNQSGWVLSRNLVMSIPDEVAQYAEGKRISSYFDLGAVKDEEKGLKHNWLWTTSSGVQAFDFDAWRVFLWNRHRHRYETSYRQRDLEGYFPVHVDPADANAFGRTFQFITKDDDGKFRERSYIFDGTRVHLTATADNHPGEPRNPGKGSGLDTDSLEAKAPKEGWVRKQWSALTAKFLAKH